MITGCSPDVHQLPINEEGSANMRSDNPEIDVLWLKDFQSHLKDKRDNIITANTYSIEEAIYGIETLINMKYGSGKDSSINSEMFYGTINLDLQTENYYDLLMKIEDFVVTRKDFIEDVVMVHLSEDLVSGDTIKFKTLIVGCNGDEYFTDAPVGNCDTIFRYNGMYLGSHAINDKGKFEVTS